MSILYRCITPLNITSEIIRAILKKNIYLLYKDIEEIQIILAEIQKVCERNFPIEINEINSQKDTAENSGISITSDNSTKFEEAKDIKIINLKHTHEIFKIIANAELEKDLEVYEDLKELRIMYEEALEK
jgi:hypothetical protein